MTLEARGPDHEVTLKAHYLVACDGANSPTRKALGIDWLDLGYDQDWLVVDVEMIKPHLLPNEVLQVCDRIGFIPTSLPKIPTAVGNFN